MFRFSLKFRWLSRKHQSWKYILYVGSSRVQSFVFVGKLWLNKSMRCFYWPVSAKWWECYWTLIEFNDHNKKRLSKNSKARLSSRNVFLVSIILTMFHWPWKWNRKRWSNLCSICWTRLIGLFFIIPWSLNHYDRKVTFSSFSFSSLISPIRYSFLGSRLFLTPT